VDDEVEPAEAAIDLGEDVGDLRVVGDVQREDERIGERRGELATFSSSRSP
jgi:hypothetical protein